MWNTYKNDFDRLNFCTVYVQHYFKQVTVNSTDLPVMHFRVIFRMGVCKLCHKYLVFFSVNSTRGKSDKIEFM